MKRLAQKDLDDWFHSKTRKPLILRGARQVGKSTLVRLFAEEQGLSLHEINLERHADLDAVFKTLNMKKIIAEIEGLTGQITVKTRSLVFLDEIQATPHALQALRYFYEDHSDLAVICAGSLLEFTLAKHNFSMPVGRIEYYHLFPMNFREFLSARDSKALSVLDEISLESDLADSVHQKLLSLQREYVFTGGLPEAVSAFVESNSVLNCRKIQENILNTYADDFSKYATKTELARLQRIFRQVPGFIGRKIIYSNISRDDRSGDIKSTLELLAKSRLIWKIHHSDCSGIPISAGMREAVFKLIFADIGLLTTRLGLNWNDLQKLDARALINEGTLAEQYVAQELISTGNHTANPELFYWLREGKGSNAEVDYVMQFGSDIVPVEVKSGKSGTLKSLHQFALRKKNRLAVRFDLNKLSVQDVTAKTKDAEGLGQCEFTLLSLPLYLVCELPRLISEIKPKE